LKCADRASETRIPCLLFSSARPPRRTGPFVTSVHDTTAKYGPHALEQGRGMCRERTAARGGGDARPQWRLAVAAADERQSAATQRQRHVRWCLIGVVHHSPVACLRCWLCVLCSVTRSSHTPPTAARSVRLRRRSVAAVRCCCWSLPPPLWNCCELRLGTALRCCNRIHSF